MIEQNNKKILFRLFLVFLISLGFLILVLPINLNSSQDSGASAPLNLNSSQDSGTQDLLFNYNQINSYQTISINLARGKMYNFSAICTGSANFDLSLTILESSKDYITQSVTTYYTDNLLEAAGVPMWGDYNTWNSINFDTNIVKGISVSAMDTAKSFLVYIDPNDSSSILSTKLFIILKSTTNPAYNSIHIEWQQVSLETSMNIQYSDEESRFDQEINANSINFVKFSTLNSEDLTYSIINQTITIDNNIIAVQWYKDLSNNTRRVTNPLLIGSTNSKFVPAFNNMKLNSIQMPGILINLNPLLKAKLNWTFSSLGDSTYSYKDIPFSTDVISFTLTGGNYAWRVIQVPSTAYFEIEFDDKSIANQIYWDFSVSMYAIGIDNNLIFNLNALGYNESEKAKIFCTTLNNQFETTYNSYIKEDFKEVQYWFSANNDSTPSTTYNRGTEYLGLLITATHSPLAITDTECNITITTQNVSSYTPGESLFIGSEYGHSFGEYDAYHVRSFEFENFQQFKWGLQSENTSNFPPLSKLYCNDPETNLYEKNINNAIFSDPINTMGHPTTLRLDFDLETRVKSNTGLYVYIKNSSGTYLLASWTTTQAFSVKSYNINIYSDSNLQVIFNFTVSGSGTVDIGPIIDNVKVYDGSNIYFYDDFEGEFDKWVQFDNFGGDKKFWHISRQENTINTPQMDIIYPNSLYTMIGYAAEPQFKGFIKETFDYNPFIQPSNIGFLVIYSTNNIVENISVTVYQTVYNSVEINDGLIIASNLTYKSIIFQSGFYWQENLELPDFYPYYSLDLKRGFKYVIKFIREDSTDVLLYGNVLDSEGLDWSSNINQFFGIFVANTTYTFYGIEDETIYIKLDTIAAGIDIIIDIQIYSRLAQFPWDILAIIILAASTAISIWYHIRYVKKHSSDLSGEQRSTDEIDTNQTESLPQETLESNNLADTLKTNSNLEEKNENQ